MQFGELVLVIFNEFLSQFAELNVVIFNNLTSVRRTDPSAYPVRDTVRVRVSILGVRDSFSILSLRCYSTAGRLVVSLGGRLPARYTRRKINQLHRKLSYAPYTAQFYCDFSYEKYPFLVMHDNYVSVLNVMHILRTI